MNQSGKDPFIDKKAYEIAYALWRIAAHTREEAFASHLRNKAMDVVNFSADADYHRLHMAMESIQAVITFAVDVNCISIGNAAMLAQEIGNVKAAILSHSHVDGSLDISDIFTSVGIADSEPVPEEESGDFEVEIGNRSKNRQSAILEKIRQVGDCRLADIQAILPDVSERTIRYDLESMVRQNLIERLGPGGRAVYYRVK